MKIVASKAAVGGADKLSEGERQARRELAACYRLADRMGWSDLISAHISHRVPGEPDHYLINPYGMLFDEITASSLIKTDARGSILSETDYPVNPAVLVIHAAILEARPDLNCVMHLHTRDGTAVSMQEHGLLPASQHAMVVWHQLCYHEFEGLALDDEEKRSLVRDLGATKKLMLLRNHGSISCGATMGETFMLMYQLERACRMQVAALGGSTRLYPIPDEVIAKSAAQGAQIFGKDGFVPLGQKEWAALLRRLDREDPAYRN
ncbi:MAG: class II aldolase/adducin family protein [Burkholderiaceae bacterium]